MSLLVFGCPFCSSPFQVDSQQSGQAVRCPSCGEAVTVPDADSAQTTDAIESEPASTTPDQGTANTAAVDPIVLGCPHCEGSFGVSPEMYGSQVACPHCAKPIEIRAPETTTPVKKDLSKTTGKPKLQTDVSDESGATIPRRRKRSDGDPESKRAQRKTEPNPSKKPARKRPKQEQYEDKSSPELKAKKRKARFKEVEKRPTPPIENPVTETSNDASLPPVQPESTTPTDVEEVATSGVAESMQTELPEVPPPDVFVPQSIEHLLPPAFNVLDPTRLGRRGGDQVLLPDGSGGLQTAERRVVTIMHQGKEYQLVAMTPEERRRRKIIHNVVTLVVGGLLLYFSLKAMGSF